LKAIWVVPLIIGVLISPVFITTQYVHASPGDFIVADGFGNLKSVTPSGTVSTIASGLGFPRGVAVDSGGDYIVADAGVGGNLLRVTPSGTVTTIASFFSIGELPFHVAVDLGGDFIVAVDTGGGLYRVTPGGTITNIASGIGFLRGVAVDSGGDFIVTDLTSVLRVTPSGTVTTIAGTGFANLYDVVIDSGGDFIVSDNAANLYRVTPSGTVTTIASLLGNPIGLAIEPQVIPVGGTIIPIDSTALLVAGAQTISPWLILGVIIPVGIGLAVFTLKRSKN